MTQSASSLSNRARARCVTLSCVLAVGAGSSADKDAFDAVVKKYNELASDTALSPDAIAAALQDEYVAKLGAKAAASNAAPGDYLAVRDTLRAMMDNEAWDDGSYAPLLIRLAWHSSGARAPPRFSPRAPPRPPRPRLTRPRRRAAGTYCAATRTGGCLGCFVQLR